MQFGEPLGFTAASDRKQVTRRVRMRARDDGETLRHRQRVTETTVKSSVFVTEALKAPTWNECNFGWGRPVRPHWRWSSRTQEFLKTYSCQMNVHDSQRMGDVLAATAMWRPSLSRTESDFTQRAIREKRRKVYSERRLRKIKAERAENGRETMIGIAGCVAQAEGHEIIRRSPVVDLVIGPQSYHRLPDVVRRARGGGKIVETDYAIEDKFEHLPALDRAAVRSRGVTAFLTIQEGCDKFCTFCVVPYTRGSEVSRPVAQIVAEAERLAEAGVREVTLLGQNVNAWHGRGENGENGLGSLFRLAEIPGCTAAYDQSPRDMDDEQSRPIATWSDAVPASSVQSGSDAS